MSPILLFSLTLQNKSNKLNEICENTFDHLRVSCYKNETKFLVKNLQILVFEMIIQHKDCFENVVTYMHVFTF